MLKIDCCIKQSEFHVTPLLPLLHLELNQFREILCTNIFHWFFFLVSDTSSIVKSSIHDDDEDTEEEMRRRDKKYEEEESIANHYSKNPVHKTWQDSLDHKTKKQIMEDFRSPPEEKKPKRCLF